AASCHPAPADRASGSLELRESFPDHTQVVGDGVGAIAQRPTAFEGVLGAAEMLGGARTIAGAGERLPLLPLRAGAPEGEVTRTARHLALGGTVESVESPVEVATALVEQAELHPLLVVPHVTREAETLLVGVARRLAVGVIHEQRRHQQRAPQYRDVIPALR